MSNRRTVSDRPDLRGLLLLNKPVGPTSHDVVDRVRRIFGVRRVGHTGTLDPNAGGLLVLCVGGATRFASYLSNQDKVYRAVISLGSTTDTDDTEGEVLSRFEGDLAQAADRGRVEAALDGFRGVSNQVPPSYSSKKIEGVPAYKLARRGTKPPLKPVAVRMDEIRILDFALPRIEIEVACSAGTYMRSFARDLGEKLGTGGHLEALVRARVGGFLLEQAVSLETLGDSARESLGERFLLPIERGLARMKAVKVSAAGMEKIFYGRTLDLSEGEAPLEDEFSLGPNDVRIHAVDGRFLGVGVLELIGRGAGNLRPRRLMVEAFAV